MIGATACCLGRGTTRPTHHDFVKPFPRVYPRPPSLSLPRSSSLLTPPLGDASERSLSHFIGRSGTPRHEKESPTSDGGPRQNHIVDGPLQRANGDEKGCLDEPFEKPSPLCTLKIK